MKTLFLERYIDECTNCSLSIDPQVMMKVCTSADCVPLLQNNTLMAKTTLVIFGSLCDPLIMYEGQLMDLKVLLGGTEAATTAVADVNNGITQSKMVLSR